MEDAPQTRDAQVPERLHALLSVSEPDFLNSTEDIDMTCSLPLFPSNGSYL